MDIRFIEGTDCRYEVTSDGRIISKIGILPSLIQYRTTDKGYKADLKINGVRKEYYVDRIVAEAFLPREEGKEGLIHKDNNLYNNDVSNLEWVEVKKEQKQRKVKNLERNADYFRTYYQEHKDQFLEYVRKYRSSNKNYYKEYYAKHKERILEYQKNYMKNMTEEQKQKRRDYFKKYRDTHPELVEKSRQRSKEYYYKMKEEDPEKLKRIAKEKYESNKEYFKRKNLERYYLKKEQKKVEK